MLPKIILTLLQIHIAWVYGPQLKGLVQTNFGKFEILILAVVIAVVIWLIGHLGALVLKETPPPSNAKLVTMLVLALIFAAITLVDPAMAFIRKTLSFDIPQRAYPIIGAIIGYQVKK